MKTPVTILRYSHKHGDTFTVHASEEAARAELVDTAAQYWETLPCLNGGTACGVEGCEGVPSQPDKLTDEQIISTYFDHTPDESFELTSSTLDDPAAQRSRAARLDVYRLRVAQAAQQLREHWPTATAIEFNIHYFDLEDPASRAHLTAVQDATGWQPVQTEDIPMRLVQIIENTNLFVSDALWTGVNTTWPEAVHGELLDHWSRDGDPEDATEDTCEGVVVEETFKLTLPPSHAHDHRRRQNERADT